MKVTLRKSASARAVGEREKFFSRQERFVFGFP